MTTRKGDKAVGTLYRGKSSVATLLLLPYIDFYSANFMIEHEGEENGLETRRSLRDTC
jgi:hypothetical protein